MIPRWVGSAEMIIQSNFLDLPLEALPSPQLLHLSCIPTQEELRGAEQAPEVPARGSPAALAHHAERLGGSLRCTRGGAEGEQLFLETVQVAARPAGAGQAARPSHCPRCNPAREESLESVFTAQCGHCPSTMKWQWARSRGRAGIMGS
ncbi:unnamed protein product [Rangifer tarandus platyrhynchus]|uniref:Uncharacterized protein n=2 Tax=Rangifer tarandus platyrhynchus TaxID=3082113 RepID=A0ABN8XWL4_RANTA|nr:unnamed protein product [Rangifer tarandus platyrhynchus]CAI9713578.1 unnamed protein product [Rangifer tarandus platyrhynchus]